MIMNPPATTDWKSCSPSQGAILVLNKEKRVRLGSHNPIICYDVSVPTGGGNMKVYLDFGSTTRHEQADANAEVVIAQLFPEYTKLDVSAGQQLEFAANGQLFSGGILGSRRIPGAWVGVIVETAGMIPENAQLTLPQAPEIGGCGLAHPQPTQRGITIMLSLPYSYIDLETSGR
jgi:hypothetical protein